MSLVNLLRKNLSFLLLPVCLLISSQFYGTDEQISPLLTVAGLLVVFALFCFLSGGSAPRAIAGDLKSLKFVNGKKVDITEGTVTAIVWWSHKSRPCLQSLSHVRKAYERYRGKDVQFVAITIENEAEVSEYLQKNKLTFPNDFSVAVDEKPYITVRKFSVRRTPWIVVVDRDGGLTYRGHASNIEVGVEAALDPTNSDKQESLAKQKAVDKQELEMLERQRKLAAAKLKAA